MSYPPGSWWLRSPALPWPYLPWSCWRHYGCSHRCTPRCSCPSCQVHLRIPSCRSLVLTAVLFVAVHLVAAILATAICVVYLATVILNGVFLILILLGAAILAKVLLPLLQPPSLWLPLPQLFSSCSSPRSCLPCRGRRCSPTRLIIVCNF